MWFGRKCLSKSGLSSTLALSKKTSYEKLNAKMADDDKSKNLFVTVGTTSFDQLIKTICHEDSIQVCL